MQEIYQKHHKRGFQILAFPCNQFGGQEPKPAAEVRVDMVQKFGITFPLFDKIDVNGPTAHPLFAFLQKFLPGMPTNAIKWNFAKFLCVNGVPVKRYAPTTSPQSIEPDIVEALDSVSTKSNL